MDGHVHAFAFFGAVPRSNVYDNDRCLVAKILPDGTLPRARLFSAFLSHYVIRDRYARPGTLITSNLPFDEWTDTFGSVRLTGALLDSLTHHVSILEMNGESYRLAHSRARKAKTRP